jgi:hypothetical protein
VKNLHFFTLIVILASCARYPSRTVPTGFNAEPNILDKPFQVVHAERTRKVGDSIEVRRLQHLFSNDLVKLENSGYLLLAHFTGRFFELEGDTIIDISELAEQTSQELNINPNAVKHRTDIQLLYRDERKFNYYPGAVSRCVSYPMALISPATNTAEIFATKPEICISWEYSMNTKPESFEIQIKNIFDESLDTLSTENSELTLNLSQYEYEVGLYILKIYDSQNLEIQAPEIGIKVGKEHYFVPKTCNLNTAVKALEMAYYLETNRYYFDATKYYELATELSERPIFDELLEHYKRRK